MRTRSGIAEGAVHLLVELSVEWSLTSVGAFADDDGLGQAFEADGGHLTHADGPDVGEHDNGDVAAALVGGMYDKGDGD